MKEKRIEVSLVKDNIATCNACLVGNYESSVASNREKVDKLYEVRIDRMCLRLCKRCLLELVGEAAIFLLNEEVSNNLCGESELLKWSDLTKAEQEQAKETYIRIREDEEERDSDEITNDYPELIDGTGVEGCSFERQADGYISVII